MCPLANFLGSIKPCTQATFGLLSISDQHISGKEFHVWVGKNEIFFCQLFYLFVNTSSLKCSVHWNASVCPRLVCKQRDGT